MNTNSKRYRLQVLMERAIGCSDPAKLGSYKQKFESYVVSHKDSSLFRDALIDDAVDTYYKGALSMTEAIAAIHKGHQSWAIVKLYYSTFYFLRAFFGTRDLGIVKCSSSIYTIDVSPGSSAVRRTGVKHKGQDVRGDHKTTIYIFEKDFSQNELILSNTINGDTVFEWMMTAREDVHYRHSTFSEPNMDFLLASMSNIESMNHWLKLYISDETSLFIFQEDHCSIATPLYLMKKLKKEFDSRHSIKKILSDEQQTSLTNIISSAGLDKAPALRNLLFD